MSSTVLTPPGVLDTRFRAALARMAQRGRLRAYTAPVDTELEIAGLMKRLDGGPALLFSDVRGHTIPVIGNFLAARENCEAAFGVDYVTIREFIVRALAGPLAPERVTTAPVQRHVITQGIDIGRLLPVLKHTAADSGRFITAGVVVTRDPDTSVYNASYHRLQLVGPDTTAIQLDLGRHLRVAWERAKARGEALPIAICIGTDIALQYAAATMGSQMPEGLDELAVAGGLAGRALPVADAITQPLLVPAESEIVLEGRILPDRTVPEGPFGEFVGYLSSPGQAPLVEITAITHRTSPIYHAINGYGRETVMLRKYVLEASLLKVLTASVPIVVDAEMTAGGQHRFHAVIQVRKTSPQHNGLQRNAILAAFGALKDLDLVTVVDDDIDIRDPADVEYAIATRMEASRDLFTIPGARGHEYVRVGQNGIRTKLGIDATVAFEDRARFARAQFVPVDVQAGAMVAEPGQLATLLGSETE
jgi:2,5-furandicarboxylate decarboxylase 1